MARKRTIATAYNIKYVRNNNGRIEWRPRLTEEQRAHLPDDAYDARFYLRPPIALGRDGDDPDDIYRAYLAAKEALNKQDAWEKHSIGWCVDQYMNSHKFKSLVPDSQRKARSLMRIIDHPLMLDGMKKTLADVKIYNMTKPRLHAIASVRLAEYQEKGKKGVVQVNRETTFLSTALNWCVNYIDGIGINENPLAGYKREKEIAVTRLVSDEEYYALYEIAGNVRPWLQPCIELTYLMATRGIETLDLRLSHCTDEGITVARRKGSDDNIIEWTPRLRDAYRAALKLHEGYSILMQDPFLICKKDGSKFSRSTVQAAFQEIKKIMKESGIGEMYWSLHLAKSKGITDSENDRLAGHVSEAMRNRYTRKLRKHKAAK